MTAGCQEKTAPTANVHERCRESLFSTEDDRSRPFPSASAAANAVARRPPRERLGELSAPGRQFGDVFCSAGFQTCCLADFQIRKRPDKGRSADWEVGDTAGLETQYNHKNDAQNQPENPTN